MKSFVDHGHDYDLYSYSSPTVPKGVRVLDADEILPRNEIFYYRRGRERGSVAGFSNLFRYRLLALRGGWWVDTDVICLSPNAPEREIFIEREDENLIGSAIIRFPKGHSFVNALYEKKPRIG